MGASESKLAFKEDIFRLSGEPDIPADSPWWSRFYQLPESAEDVFALWSPNDLRHLTNNADTSNTSPKKNAETLIYIAVARLEALQTRRVHEDPLTPIAPEVLNCVRILTRLLPYIYEADHLAGWETRFFWEPRKATWVWDKKYNRRGPLFDGLNPSKRLPDGTDNDEIDRPLGERLIDLLINYLFLPNFALPKKLDANGNPDLHVSYSIWQSGIGCKQSQGMTRENERNAMEVLRLLLTLSSRMMYLPSNMVAQIDIKALTYITTQCSRQAVLSLICSLLNTVLKYNPASWRVPLDLTAVTRDPKQLLVTYSLQLLLVLIIYPVPNDQPNAFRKSLSRLHRVEDFQFIQQGITLVLTQPVSGVASYVPTVSKALPWAPEMLVLFWELLQCNKRFRSFIIDTDRAHDFIVLVLYYAMDAKDDPARQGIVRMCVFILQTLSVEPTFGRRLNKPFVGQDSLPSTLRIPNFHGTYADYLITSLHTMLTTTKGRLESIYPALLAIVNNIAPYVQDLQRATCTKLLDLFISFSSPAFLLANDSNHTLLLSLLEAMSAVLDHQHDANRRFVDIVCRTHKRFEALRDFTVDGALSEVDRINQERKDRNGSISGITSPTRGASMDSIRSPASSRSPSLGNVPEHGAFAIGDDEDDDEDLETPINSPHARSQSTASTSTDDAVPVQTRSMSEKARGKQPVGQSAFSRSASRNTSNTSLASLQTQTPHPLTTSTQFTPTAEWLESWLPHMPLHTILQVIEQGKSGTSKPRGQQAASASTPKEGSEETPETPNSEYPPPPIRLQTFTWSPLALGWYMSMLWGFIFASDAQNNRGSNGLWAGTSIKLFNIANRQGEISLRSPTGAVDAVGDSLARRIGSFGFGGAGAGSGGNGGGGGGAGGGVGAREG